MLRQSPVLPTTFGKDHIFMRSILTTTFDDKLWQLPLAANFDNRRYIITNFQQQLLLTTIAASTTTSCDQFR